MTMKLSSKKAKAMQSKRVGWFLYNERSKLNVGPLTSPSLLYILFYVTITTVLACK